MIKKLTFALALFLTVQLSFGQKIETVSPPFYNNNGTYSLNPRYLTVMGGYLYFFGTDDPGTANGNKLWKSNGDWSGTTIVKQINNGGAQSPSIVDLKALGNLLFFNDNSDASLWRSDGTPDGTYKLLDKNARNLTLLNGKVYFNDYSAATSISLWVTDGTVAGTKAIKQINNTKEVPTSMMVYKNRIFFGASDGVNKQQLWVSDGTDTGTHLFKKINNGNDAAISNLVIMNNYLYFVAKHNATESQIWRTNGTSDSTIKITAQCVSCSSGLAPSSLIEYHKKLYFKGSNGGTPYQLWVCDGTDTGTRVLKSEIVGTGPYPSGFADNGFQIIKHNDLLFMAGSDSTGTQIWKSNGTKTGTVKVTTRKNLGPFNLISFDNHIVFLASRKDSVYDIQLHYTDGNSDAIMPMIYDQYNDNPFWHITQDAAGQRFAEYNGALYFPCTYNYWESFRLYRFYFTKPSGVRKVGYSKDNISVYPNPANGLFNIILPEQLNDANIEIYNSLGVLVYTQIRTGELNTFDLRNCKNGLYIIKIISKNQTVSTQKLIIQN